MTYTVHKTKLFQTLLFTHSETFCKYSKEEIYIL